MLATHSLAIDFCEFNWTVFFIARLVLRESMSLALSIAQPIQLVQLKFCIESRLQYAWRLIIMKSMIIFFFLNLA